MAGISPPYCAAREAYEEAGVRGEISMASAGRFPYLKRMRSGTIREVMVEAYALKVTEQAETWPEKGQRDCRWFSAEEAASLVAEEGLASLIRRFARSQR
jgi:8-oxo-dGTP pyrophosphatase MutT (NUDIX family)